MFSYKKTSALVLAALVLAAQGNVVLQEKLAQEIGVEAQNSPVQEFGFEVKDGPVQEFGFEVNDGPVQEFEVEARQPALVEQRSAEPTAVGLGLSADVNNYVDSTIHMIVPFLREYGLDPMPLPEVIEGFRVRYLLITYSAWLKIHQGSMTGLTNVERSGDQMVHYFARMLRVRIVLNFKDLLFDYKYLVQVMNIGPTGGIEAILDRYEVTVDVLIDFNNDEVHLQEFSISEIGRLRVRFTISVLVDWLLIPVLNVFISIFDTIIIKVVESNIHSAVNHVIAVINSNIKEVIDKIESFN